MPAILICGDTLRSPELRHEVPLGIGDPFLYLETDGRRAVLTNVLEVDRIAAAAPELERLLGEQFGRDELIAQGLSYEQIDRELYVRAVRELGITAAVGAARLPARGRRSPARRGHRADGRRRALRRAPAPQDRRRAGRHPPRGATPRWPGVEECARVLREAEIDGDGLRYEGEVLTSELLRARIREVCARLGAPAPDDIIVAPMRPGDAVGHEAGSGPLPAHAPICLDLWPQDEASGCWADMTRTWVRGDISDAVADLHRLVLEAHERSLAATRPGVLGVDVYGAACDVFEAAGHPTQRTKKPGRDAPARLLLRPRPRRRARGPRGAGARAHRPRAAHRRRRRRHRAGHGRSRARRDARRGPGARHRRRLRAAHRAVVRSRALGGGWPRRSRSPGGRIRSSTRCSASRAPPRLRALFDRFPDGGRPAVGDPRRRRAIVDFDFGYGNPAIMRLFRAAAHACAGATRCSRRCRRCAAAASSTPTCGCARRASRCSDEITFDTPFGDGYIHGTLLRRTAKLGDGLIVFVDRRDRRSGAWRPSCAATPTWSPTTCASRSPASRTSSRCSSAAPTSRPTRGPAPPAREHRARARAHRRRARLRARGRAAARARRAGPT